jgi:hypothetical protein
MAADHALLATFNKLGLNQSRLAIHAAGGNTPGWDGMIPKLLETEEFQSTVMPSTWRQVHVV